MDAGNQTSCKGPRDRSRRAKRPRRPEATTTADQLRGPRPRWGLNAAARSGVAAVVLAAATAHAAATRPASAAEQPAPKNSLAGRLRPGPGFSVHLAGCAPAELRRRWQIKSASIGTVAEDPVTGLRVVQHRQWEMRLGLLLLEYRVAHGGREPVTIRSLAMVDWVFGPPRGPKAASAPVLKPPAVRTLGRDFRVGHHLVTAAEPVEITADAALPMAVLVDERRGGGIALALADTQTWRMTIACQKAGRLRLRIETKQHDQPITLHRGDALSLATLAVATYRGSWPRGAAKLRRLWTCGYAGRRWQRLRGKLAAAFARASANQSPQGVRRLLSEANFFLPPSLLPCVVAAPPGQLRGPRLEAAFRSYLAGSWENDAPPSGLSEAARRAFQAAADVHARIAPLMEELYLRPLPPPRTARQWDALQFHSRRRRAGVVLVFRQDSAEPRCKIHLRALRAANVYRLWDPAGLQGSVARGRDLMRRGIDVALPVGGSRVLRYEAVRPRTPDP